MRKRWKNNFYYNSFLISLENSVIIFIYFREVVGRMNCLMEARKHAYVNFNLLCDKLDYYGFEQSEKNEADLFSVVSATCHEGFPLPSGRWGNALAVAMEMHMYVGALYLIQNAEQLEIDLDIVSSQYDGADCQNAQQVFELSKSYFDDQKIGEDDEVYREYPNDRQYHNDNVDAFLAVTELLKSKSKTMKK